MIFFTSTTGVPFILFGPLYFTLILSVIGLTALMYRFRTRLRRLRYNRILPKVFAGILFSNMAVYYIGLMLVGEYDIKKHLPLDFCFITGFFLMFILITNNRHGFYSTIFYCTIIGPLPAIIWPNLSGSYDRYIFYQFIISHHFMMLVSFYCIIVLGYRVAPKGALRAFIYGNIVFGAVSIINILWGSNYIMQQKLPDHILKLYPFIETFNYPIFWLEVCGAAMLLCGVRLAKLFQRDRCANTNPTFLQAEPGSVSRS